MGYKSVKLALERNWSSEELKSSVNGWLSDRHPDDWGWGGQVSTGRSKILTQKLIIKKEKYEDRTRRQH